MLPKILPWPIRIETFSAGKTGFHSGPPKLVQNWQSQCKFHTAEQSVNYSGDVF
jgi:hypothetical protein